MADQIPDRAKMDAVDILKTYAAFIREDVRAADLERHPYLPHIEQTIEDLRAAPPAMDREAVERMVALVEALSDVPRDTVLGQSGYASEARSIRAALSTLSADAIRQGEGWQPIETAPRDEEVVVQVGDMTFHAKLLPDAGMNGLDEPCDQWAATREGEHPPCWTGGLCWESNEDDVTSIQPRAWMPAPASHASDGGKAA